MILDPLGPPTPLWEPVDYPVNTWVKRFRMHALREPPMALIRRYLTRWAKRYGYRNGEMIRTELLPSKRAGEVTLAVIWHAVPNRPELRQFPPEMLDRYKVLRAYVRPDSDSGAQAIPHER